MLNKWYKVDLKKAISYREEQLFSQILALTEPTSPSINGAHQSRHSSPTLTHLRFSPLSFSTKPRNSNTTLNSNPLTKHKIPEPIPGLDPIPWHYPRPTHCLLRCHPNTRPNSPSYIPGFAALTRLRLSLRPWHRLLLSWNGTAVSSWASIRWTAGFTRVVRLRWWIPCNTLASILFEFIPSWWMQLPLYRHYYKNNLRWVFRA